MDLLDVEKTIEALQVELKNDVTMDELTLKEKAMLAPATKQKWVGYTVKHKNALLKLELLKKQKIKEKTVNSPVALSKAARDEIIYNDDDIGSINIRIEQLKLILDYLEKVEKLTGSLTFDYKNAIDLQKLETT